MMQKQKTSPSRRPGFFTPIGDLQSADRAARSGAAAGLISAMLRVLELMRLPGAYRWEAEELLAFVAVDWILVVIVLFLSWRIGIHRGLGRACSPGLCG
jgi:hypothetical protein